MEISQQIVRQVRQENITFLTEEAAFSASFQAQTRLIVAELLYFSTASGIIGGHKQPF